MGSRKVIYVIVIFLLVISIVYFPGVVGEDHRIITEEEFQDKLENEDYDFSWCVFPFGFNLSDYTFKTNVNFYEARFQKGANFCNATFKGDRADFTSAEFNGTANFDSAHFEEFVIFTNTIFHGNALFNNTTFKKYTDFVYVEVEENKKEQETFQGEAEFNHAIFEKEVSFLNITFKKNAAFKQTTFKDRVIFQTTRFENDVTFHKAIFEDYVQFSHGTIFGGENGEYKSTDFTETEFNGQTSFSNSTFYIEADFQSAKFKGDTYFVGTIFEYNVNFRDAKFYEEANFNTATFESYANFIYVSFKGDTYFIGTTFKDSVNFIKSKFEQNFDFESQKINRLILIQTQAYGHGHITTNLEEAFFKDAYLQDISFIDCDWPDNFILYEESTMKDYSDYSYLERIYRNLKVSFQNYGDNEMVGEFFYREMEMKRERTLFLKEPIKWILLHILWLTCGYGERLLYLIICSLGIMGLFAIFFLILGIEVNKLPWRFEFFDYRGNIQEIENRHKIHRSHEHRILNSIWSFFSWLGIKDFAYCLLFSITSFSTLGTKYIKPRGNASRWLSAVESLIGAFFIALFIYVFARKMLR